MAKVRGAVVGLYVVFLLNINYCNSAEDENINYNENEVISNLPKLQNTYLLNIREKTQAIEPEAEYKSLPFISTTKSENANLYIASSENKASDIKQEPPGEIDTGGEGNVDYVNISPAQVHKEQPLLGRNGAGQRKVYSISEFDTKKREKRQATGPSTEYKQLPSTNTTQPTNTNTFNASSDNNATDVKQAPTDKMNTGVSSTVDPMSTSPIPTIKERPLLGVNGTGQRKIYPSTLKPPVVSEPINPKPNLKNTKLSSPKVPEAYPSDDFIDSVDQPDENTNTSLTRHNVTTLQEDYHEYYNSTVIMDKDKIAEYWELYKNIPPNQMLSKSHRRAMTVQLSFSFPFYGHPIRNVTVATGGFLYTGEYVHSWLAATQYIAPLMANFDTNLSNDSYVRYIDNGTSFTVVWENVALQDKPDLGNFTFATTLHKNGNIVFTYFSVPVEIEAIQDHMHPVKVGLSDAYIIDKVIFFARRKTIYEYHRVNFSSQKILNATIIYLNALPTCLEHTDCASCLTARNSNFRCNWCPTLNKCSTGTDRQRQEWLHKGCDKTQITNGATCPALGTKGNNAAMNSQSSESGESSPNDGWLHPINKNDSSIERSIANVNSVIKTIDGGQMEPSTKEKESSSTGLVLSFMLPICFIMCALLWVLYAYRNPHTKSGQLLIQYRPSQWTWRRGEARYTAATIHM